MNMRLNGSEWKSADVDWLVAAVPEAETWPENLKALDDTLEGLLTRLRERGDLSGKLGEVSKILDVPQIAARRLLCIGLGPADKLGPAALNKIFSTAARAISEKPRQTVGVAIPSLPGSDWDEPRLLEIAATAFAVGCVGQGIYQKEPGRHPLERVEFLCSESASHQTAVDRGGVVGEGINLARELVNLSPEDMYPERFALRAGELAKELGLECEVFDESRLESERMAALLAVARGSAGRRGWWS